jgi:hypothetical protein
MLFLAPIAKHDTNMRIFVRHERLRELCNGSLL